MTAYIILIVVVAVLLVGAGGAVLLRPRGMHGVRRGRARELDLTGPMPRAGEGEGSSGTATATATAPPPVAEPTAPPEPPQPTIEKPPPSAGRMVRLRARLARSHSGFGSALLGLLSRDRLDDDTWDELEEVLITADVGVTTARQITSDLRTRVKVEGSRTPDEVRAMLRGELLSQVETEASRALRTQRHEGRPAVLLVVGVTGTGKTTTCGKLGRVLVGDGRTVVLGAADTFRAAAADQLQTWGERVGAQVVRSDKEQA
ncbi:MAG TPA: signal recognition particle receptor subunit alpha, partial [Trebonia sp.]|nr:signal recognition particle receptor subunit alpha [Trebonia sp.]